MMSRRRHPRGATKASIVHWCALSPFHLSAHHPTNTLSAARAMTIVLSAVQSLDVSVPGPCQPTSASARMNRVGAAREIRPSRLLRHLTERAMTTRIVGGEETSLLFAMTDKRNLARSTASVIAIVSRRLIQALTLAARPLALLPPLLLRLLLRSAAHPTLVPRTRHGRLPPACSRARAKWRVARQSD